MIKTKYMNVSNNHNYLFLPNIYFTNNTTKNARKIKKYSKCQQKQQQHLTFHRKTIKKVKIKITIKINIPENTSYCNPISSILPLNMHPTLSNLRNSIQV